MDKYNGNRVVMELTGQIGKISDLKYTKAGTAFVEFSIYALINKQRYWYNNLVAYEQNAQELKNYAHKNTKTTVFAFPKEISWKDKETGFNRTKYVKHVTGLSLHLNEIRSKNTDNKSAVADSDNIDDEANNKIKIVNDLWSKSVPLEGTIGEQYLKEHRGILDTSNLEIRFIPKGTDMTLSDGAIKPSFAPMIIIGGFNANNELVSAQRIYLDQKTANKNTYIDTPKLSMGLIGGSAGLIQKGTDGKVYLVEGPETGASIAQVKTESSVYCTFGLGNLRKLVDFIKANNFEEVILAADNDGDSVNTKNLIDTAISELKQQGIDIKVMHPPLIDGFDKSDWNDILVLLGKDKLTQLLEK